MLRSLELSPWINTLQCVASCVVCGYACNRSNSQISDLQRRTIEFVPAMYPLYELPICFLWQNFRELPEPGPGRVCLSHVTVVFLHFLERVNLHTSGLGFKLVT